MTQVVSATEKPGTTRKPTKFYRPELDMMRFFAFLAVFVHHTRWTYEDAALTVAPVGSAIAKLNPSGFAASLKLSLSAGVSLFFFLSAYLITTLLVMELDTTGTVHVQSFYARRILRIWPLYFVYLAFAICLGLAFSDLRVSGAAIASYLLFVGNWFCVAHDWHVSPIVGLLWSISIEEQFYLFSPLSVRILKQRGLAIFSVASCCVSCILLLVFGFHGVSQDSILRPNTFIQMLFLSGGTLTALILRGRVTRMQFALRPFAALGGILCWAMGYWQFGPDSYRGQTLALSPLFCYLLILAGVLLIFFAFLGLEARHVPGWMSYLGKISYGLYVWHMLAFWLLAQIWVFPRGHSAALLGRSSISLLLAVVFAAMSYQWLERPFLKMKDRFAFVKSRAA